MPGSIERDEVRSLVDRGAQLIEVLASREYDEEHLPGAINIPLSRMGSQADRLDRARPVIVYCWDYQ